MKIRIRLQNEWVDFDALMGQNAPLPREEEYIVYQGKTYRICDVGYDLDAKEIVIRTMIIVHTVNGQNMNVMQDDTNDLSCSLGRKL